MKDIPMTDDERDKMLTELYNALMVARPGQDKPLVDRMELMSRDWNRFGWVMRGVLVTILTLGSIFAAWEKIVQFFTGAS